MSIVLPISTEVDYYLRKKYPNLRIAFQANKFYTIVGSNDGKLN